MKQKKSEKNPSQFGSMPRSAKWTGRDVEVKLVPAPCAEYLDWPEAEFGSETEGHKPAIVRSEAYSVALCCFDILHCVKKFLKCTNLFSSFFKPDETHPFSKYPILGKYNF